MALWLVVVPVNLHPPRCDLSQVNVIILYLVCYGLIVILLYNIYCTAIVISYCIL